jgi:cell fate regulator YaaT (PSP1 superfamily)
VPNLPMTVFDAEYTFDRSKLTLYYNSEVHIDFRELVKDMYARFKTRIWMKKMNQEPPFYPKHFATVQLLTGAQLTPY